MSETSNRRSEPDAVIRDFHIGDVLSVTTGRLVSPRHVDGLYDLMGYMTGERLMTHQLPRAMDDCRPEILRQHPDLERVKVPDTVKDEASCLSWLLAISLLTGEMLPIEPLVGHAGQDPIEELADMVGPERIIVFPENPEPPQ